MTPSAYVDFWAEWFGIGRGVGNPTRDYISDPEAFVKWIKNNEDKRICSYASVQPFEAYEAPYCLEKLFFDFDCKEDPERAGEEARGFAMRLRKFYEVDPLLVFSGNKGYHLYVFLQRPFGVGMEIRALKTVYDKLQRMLVGKARYETLDSSVLGDIKQLARIPYTHHEKTGKVCQPLNEQCDPIEAQSGFVEYYQKHGLSFETCKRGLYRAAEDKKEEERRRKAPRRTPRNFPNSLRPCTQAILTKSHLSHKMRLGLVAELNKSGWSVHRIVNAFSGFIDFDRRKTEYQVKNIVRKGYSPFKCSTIEQEGECLHDECWIYRRRTRIPLKPVNGWGVVR